MTGKTPAQRGRLRSRRRLPRPTSAKGWLLTLLLAAAVVTLKLTIGAALILALWHLVH